MLMDNGDGTYLTGPLDALIILQHQETDLFHVAFFQEHSFPGPYVPAEKVKIVRLIAHSHHTEGAATMQEALVQREELRQRVQVPKTNLFDEVVAWDGALGAVLIYPNWLKPYPSPSF